MPEKIVSVNLDANETIFFARELEYVKSKSYDIVYPQFRALELIPVSSEADSGAETITYDQYDSVGLAKIIADYADDLPRSDTKGRQFTSSVRGIGGSYGYSIQEIRRAQMTGKPLQQRKANASRRANDQLTDSLAWKGDSNYNIIGLLYHPNVTKSVVQTGATSGNVTWAPGQKTPDEIVTDMMDAIDDVKTLTKGVESPDTLLIPLSRWGRISGTRMASGTDTTILDFFRKNRPNVNVVEGGIADLDAVNPSPTGVASAKNVMIAYERNIDKISLEIPQPYEQFPAQERNLEMVIPTHSRVGGVIIYYPLSVNIVEGI
jgi:hypothetical protein